MAQKFSDDARAFLQGSIGAGDTSLTVTAALADYFPVANTAGWGTIVDWFKATLIDVVGNREVVYVGVRTLGSGVFSNLLRGQDGTTALAFAAGSVVMLAFSAVDMAGFAQAAAVQAAAQNQTYTAGTTAGSGTAYTLAPTPAIAAYAANQSFYVTFHAACGSNPTLQISGVATPPNLVKQLPGGTYSNIVSGDIPVNHRSRVTLLSPTQALVEELPLPDAATTFAPKAITANWAFALGDRGALFVHATADATVRTGTIPANAAVAFPVGTTFTIANQSGAGALNIVITTDTLRLAGIGTTGSRVIAVNGLATLVKITATEWMISGAGVS